MELLHRYLYLFGFPAFSDVSSDFPHNPDFLQELLHRTASHLRGKFHKTSDPSEVPLSAFESHNFSHRFLLHCLHIDPHRIHSRYIFSDSYMLFPFSWKLHFPGIPAYRPCNRYSALHKIKFLSYKTVFPDYDTIYRKADSL